MKPKSISTQNCPDHSGMWVQLTGSRLIHICSDHRLFRQAETFVIKSGIGSVGALSSPQFRIVHVATGHWWHGSVDVCPSRWSSSVDSDHALVYTRFSLQLFCCHPNTKPTHLTYLILNDNCRDEVRQKLSMRLSVQLNIQETREHCEQIKDALQSTADAMKDPKSCGPHKQWVFSTAADLLDTHRSVSLDTAYDELRKPLRQ